MAELSVKFDERKRHAVYARDNHTCAYCRRKDVSGRGANLSVDHITARNLGGEAQNGVTSGADNLITACLPCNSSKQDKTPREWSAYAKKRVEEKGSPPPTAPPDWASIRRQAQKKIDIKLGAELAEKARALREERERAGDRSKEPSSKYLRTKEELEAEAEKGPGVRHSSETGQFMAKGE